MNNLSNLTIQELCTELKQTNEELAKLAQRLLSALLYEAEECGIDNYAESTIELIEEAKNKIGVDYELS